MGRRPLCVCLLIFLAVYLAIYSRMEEKEAGSQTSYNGQQMELTGIVQKIDIPLADQGDTYVLYLDQAKKLISATNLSSENQLFHSSTEICSNGNSVLYLAVPSVNTLPSTPV